MLKEIYDTIVSRCEAVFALLARHDQWLVWGVA